MKPINMFTTLTTEQNKQMIQEKERSNIWKQNNAFTYM